MTKQTVDGIEIELSSGNVFADLGLPDAEQLLNESGQAIERTLAKRRVAATRQVDPLRPSTEPEPAM